MSSSPRTTGRWAATARRGPFLYTLDQPVQVGHFGQQDSWQVPGLAEYVAVGLTVFGWSLGLAVVAVVSRTLTRI